jgi:hypothetical protein
MYLFLFFMIIIILLLISSKESFTSSKESFTSSPYSNKGCDIYNIHSNKINFMYTKHDGIYKKFSDIYILEDNINTNPSIIRNVLKNIDVVETGFYNYKYNYLGLLYKNNIYKFNLFTQKIEPPIFSKDYFKGIKDTNIKCLFYLEDKIYIFYDKKIIIYNLKEHKIIKTINSNKLFEKCPSNIECCFLNYNDIELNNSIPYIYILSNDTYYKYKYGSNKFTFIEQIKDLKNNIIIDASKKHKIMSDGYYRITCIGGGTDSGGKGGLIFNDVKLNKNDGLKIIIGKKGNRLPVKSTNLIQPSQLSILPNTGSCSGSGATSLYKNGELNMIAGGGGGWTSEIITSPSICNSVPYTKNLLNEFKGHFNPTLFFPIKKIVIISPTGKDMRYKIIVNKFDVKVTDFESLNLDIYEYPKITFKNSTKAKYETDLSKFKEKASIEIIFDKVICDYKIDIDFKVVSNDNNSISHIDSKLVIYDEQNREYVISNFNETFNSKIITSEKLLNHFSNGKLPGIEYNNDLVKNGASKHTYNSVTSNHSQRHFYLDNGTKLCGGGYATSNKFNTLNTCGGGGGYKGGKGISLNESYNYKNIKFPIDYVGACGGSSYINNLSIKNSESHFINNYNEDDGIVIITKLTK